jgi:hypothetical protein
MKSTVVTQQHHLSPPLIRIVDLEAAVESYFMCAQYLRAPEGPEDELLEMTVGGRYVDKLVKRGNGWRILERAVVLLAEGYALLRSSLGGRPGDRDPARQPGSAESTGFVRPPLWRTRRRLSRAVPQQVRRPNARARLTVSRSQ